MSTKYAGMTVNERLFIAGYLDEFDKAIKEKDIEKVISILKSVELPDSAIDPILERVGLKSKASE